MKAQAYTLDALISLIIFVAGLLIILSLPTPVNIVPPESSDSVLGSLLSNYEIQRAIYNNDSEKIASYLNSILPEKEYYFVVYNRNWDKIMEIGKNFEGISSIAEIIGINGTINIRYIILKIRD